MLYPLFFCSTPPSSLHRSFLSRSISLGGNISEIRTKLATSEHTSNRTIEARFNPQGGKCSGCGSQIPLFHYALISFFSLTHVCSSLSLVKKKAPFPFPSRPPPL